MAVRSISPHAMTCFAKQPIRLVYLSDGGPVSTCCQWCMTCHTNHTHWQHWLMTDCSVVVSWPLRSCWPIKQFLHHESQSSIQRLFWEYNSGVNTCGSFGTSCYPSLGSIQSFNGKRVALLIMVLRELQPLLAYIISVCAPFNHLDRHTKASRSLLF